MTVRLRVLLSVGLALGSIWSAQLAAPSLVHACSCAPTGPEEIGKAAEFPDSVVFIGMVTAMDPMGNNQGHTFGEMKIERLFKGSMPAVVRVKGGGGGDCTMSLAVAQHMITVGSYVDGVLTPMLCNPYADPNTPDGQGLIEAAVAAYGPGVAPGVPPEGTNPPAAPTPTAGIALPLVLGAAVAVAVVMFGLIAIVASARRRREEPIP